MAAVLWQRLCSCWDKSMALHSSWTQACGAHTPADIISRSLTHSVCVHARVVWGALVLKAVLCLFSAVSRVGTRALVPNASG